MIKPILWFQFFLLMKFFESRYDPFWFCLMSIVLGYLLPIVSIDFEISPNRHHRASHIHSFRTTRVWPQHQLLALHQQTSFHSSHSHKQGSHSIHSFHTTRVWHQQISFHSSHSHKLDSHSIHSFHTTRVWPQHQLLALHQQTSFHSSHSHK